MAQCRRRPALTNSNDGSPSRQLTSLESRTLMNSAQQMNFGPNAVPHPGGAVLEYLDFYGWSQRDLARRTGLTPKTVSEICNGKAPITPPTDRKSTRLNSSHANISYAVFCLKKKKKI